MSNDEENVGVDDYDRNDINNNLALENKVGRSLRHGDDDVVDDDYDYDEKRAS